jgi:hypothetical protein
MNKALLAVMVIIFSTIPYLAAQPVTVDGVKDAFYEALTGPDDGYIQVEWFHHSDVGTPDDNADLSAKIWGAWDANYLYLYAEVTDDIISLDGATQSYETDCIEMKIDGIPDDSTGSLSKDCRFTAIDPSDVPAEDQALCDNLSTFDDADKMYARATLSGGYILEWAIALDELGGSETVNAVEGGVMGLGFNISDNDGSNREAAVVWAAKCDDAIWNTVKLHGTLKFLADNKVQFLATNNMTGKSNPYPYDGSGFIEVTSPDGGEIWETGSTHDITWTSSGTIGNVHIEYSMNNGSSWTDVIASTDDDGNHPWSLPGTASDECLVRITDADGTASDTSEAVFSIAVSNITVTSPNGGETWLTGFRESITWNSFGTGGDVKIEYSTDNGSNWADVIASTPDDGSYAWTIPDEESDECLIRVSETDLDPSDQSGAVFTIAAFPEGDVINVPADYATIAEGLDAAGTGDTVLVAAGTYHENGLWMKSGVVIKGAGIDQSIVDGDNNDYVFWGADQAILEGFTITNADHYGVFCWSSNPIISNNKITNCDQGIAVADHAIIRDNIIANNSSYGIFCGDPGSPQITRNLIVNSLYGMVSVGAEIIAYHNTIDNNSWQGFHVQKWDTSLVVVAVTNNILTNNGNYGVSIATGEEFGVDPDYVTITYNDVWNNDWADYTGWTADPTDISQDPLFVGSGMMGMEKISLSKISVFNAGKLLNDNIICKNRCAAFDEAHRRSALKKTESRIMLAKTDEPENGSILMAQTDPSNYHLQEESPCIDAGDPASSLDPDGTTADMGAYYYDQISDNTPPSIPRNPTARPGDQTITLRWRENQETDLNKYNIYRDITSPAVTFFASVAAPSPPDTFLVNTSLTNGQEYFYRITAVDNANNESGFSDEVSATPDHFVQAEIKVWLEGPYDFDADNMTTDLQTAAALPATSPYEDSREAGSIPEDITDWVFVELRTAADGTAVASRSFFLRNDGMVTDDDGTINLPFFGLTDGNYFIVVRHRNHLAVMSASAQPLNESGALSYDFTDGSGKYYGTTSGCRELETGVWGMIAGDADGSGTVDAIDRSDTWNDRNLTGYEDSDCGLTGTVDAVDRSITWNNRNLTTGVP